jgi:hypothetical protein
MISLTLLKAAIVIIAAGGTGSELVVPGKLGDDWEHCAAAMQSSLVSWITGPVPME